MAASMNWGSSKKVSRSCEAVWGGYKAGLELILIRTRGLFLSTGGPFRGCPGEPLILGNGHIAFDGQHRSLNIMLIMQVPILGTVLGPTPI